MKNYQLINGEAINELQKIAPKSIDLICVDLPYGRTKNKWDVIIPLDLMWASFNKIIKSNGVIALTAIQPFTSMLVMSNLKNFKYEIIWEKTIASGQLNVKHQPLRTHESILIFYDKKPTYNEQITKGDPYHINRKATYGDNNYNKQKPSEKINDGFRHAKSIIKISNPRIKDGHPTQKPVELMSQIIKTYTNENQMVMDCCMGSGTTGVAALQNNRRFIGIEKDLHYFQKAKQRIENL
jgi:site-specific DNA-methyltransferase (adenine-specific)